MANPATQFAFFNVAPSATRPPFKFNEVYDINGSNEASLYLSVYNEFTYLHGTDIVYIERTVYEEEPVFGEFLSKVFTRGTPMRLFIEEAQGWAGIGDTYSKFGIQIQDECTLYCPKITFEQTRPGLYPKYNDLIYVPKSRKLFEVKHIEDELPPSFYLLGNRSGYVFSCKTFTYDHSDIVAGEGIPEEVTALDEIVLDPITQSPKFDPVNDTEVEKTNVPIQTSGHSVISTLEDDPLLGGNW